MKWCYICGDMASHLHEDHHLVPRRLNGSDRDENIVRLCPGCHRALEKLYNTSFYERLSEQLRIGFSLNQRGKWVTAMEPHKGRIDDMKAIGREGDLRGRGEISRDEFVQLNVDEKLAYLYHNHWELETDSLDTRLDALYKRSTSSPSEKSIEERIAELDKRLLS